MCNIEHRLKPFPQPPEFRNAAGRLLCLFKRLAEPGRPFVQVVPDLYTQPGARTESSAVLCDHFMQVIDQLLEEFTNSLAQTDTISERAKAIIRDATKHLPAIVIPEKFDQDVEQLSHAEEITLRLVAAILPVDGELSVDDETILQRSVDEVFAVIRDSQYTAAVRESLLDFVSYSRSALDLDTIYGAPVLRRAYYRMLANLLVVQSDAGDDSLWWRQAVRHIRILDNIAARIDKRKPLGTDLLEWDSRDMKQQ